MNYGFKINGSFLDVYPDQQITLTDESPYLSENIIPGLVSLPAVLPNSRQNRKLLGNLHDLQVWDYVEDHDCDLYLFGEFYCSGKLSLIDVDAENFEFQFVENKQEKDLSELKLAELTWPEYDISINDADPNAPLPVFISQLETRNALYDELLEEKDFVAPTIYNPAAIGTNEFFSENEEVFSLKTPFQNLYFGRFDMLINESSFVGVPTYCYAINAITIMPFVRHVLKNIFRLGKNELDLNGYHNLIIYSNRIITLWNKKKPYDIFLEESPYAKNKIRFFEKRVLVKEFLPDMKTADFLSALRSTFNLSFVKSDTGTIDVLLNKTFIRSAEILRLDGLVTPYTKWTKSDKATKIKLISWAYKFSEDPGLNYNYKGRLASAGLLPGSPADGDAYFLADTGELLMWVASTATWKQLSIKGMTEAVNYMNAAGTVEVAIADTVSPAFSNAFSSHVIGASLSANIYTPSIQCSLNTQAAAWDDAPSGNPQISDPVFLLYRGMVSNPAGWQYPYASADSKAPNALTPAPHYSSSLDMFGENGLYERFFKDWDNSLRNARVVHFDLLPNSQVFRQLYQKKIAIANQQYICAKRTLKISLEKIQLCNLELLQIM